MRWEGEIWAPSRRRHNHLSQQRGPGSMQPASSVSSQRAACARVRGPAAALGRGRAKSGGSRPGGEAEWEDLIAPARRKSLRKDSRGGSAKQEQLRAEVLLAGRTEHLIARKAK